MRFVDREKEIARLQQLLKGDSPYFVIIRGRRRIGKSTLIGKVLCEKDIYYEADRTDPVNQMAELSRMVAHVIPGFDDAVYKDWRALLSAINHRVTERITLCLDEFPYLAEGTPSLPSIIQGLLDSDTDKLKYNLILCGSSQQMMYNLTHDESSPLYGRTDADFGMKAIPVNFLQEALNLDAQETIEHFAVWGGVPRYWKLAESSASLKDAIWTHILSDMGALYEEPLRLFRDDMKDIVKTSTLMSVIGGGTNRLSEIASRLGEPATNLSRPLAKLIDLGYLEKEVPFGESVKSSKRSLYRIADPFLFFYNKLFAVTFDGDFARATGTKADIYNLIIAAVIAVIVVLAMNLVGSLLISALVVFPAMSAMRVFKSFRSVTICSAVISVLCALTGMVIAIVAGTPVGSTIVVTDIAVFVIFSIAGKLTGRTM